MERLYNSCMLSQPSCFYETFGFIKIPGTLLCARMCDDDVYVYSWITAAIDKV